MENGIVVKGIKKMFEAYETVCKPYCQEIGISVQAYEILLFIAKRKGVTTAQDICKEQSIKPTLMSFHIEKLVQAGYVERQAIEGNRRSVKLVCKESAAPIIEKGAELYKRYSELMWAGVNAEEAAVLFSVLEKINVNADKIIKGEM